jgi:hypothetical protein
MVFNDTPKHTRPTEAWMIFEKLHGTLGEASHCTNEIDPMEDMDVFVAAEEAKIPFKSFNLGTVEGRKALLWKYYRIGDSSLFEAVAHIWDSLGEPKAAFGTRIGLAAGTGGMGKRGIVLMLHKFLDQALASMIAIPPTGRFDSLEDWHQASMQTFVDEEATLTTLVQHYAAVLDGKVISDTPPLTHCVLQGPWSGK